MLPLLAFEASKTLVWMFGSCESGDIVTPHFKLVFIDKTESCTAIHGTLPPSSKVLLELILTTVTFADNAVTFTMI